jgi:hypothetical protein
VAGLLVLAAALAVSWPRIGSGAAADYPYVSWQEEFDGSAVEPARWTYDLGTGSQYGLTGWGNNELQSYTNRPQNASVSGGTLKITALKENYGGQAYTSARLKTQGLFSQAGGRFEIRAALPTGQGLWPAIWMLPDSDTYGGWAASGEIDIMEARGQQPDRVAGTIHYGGAWPGNTQSGATRILPAGGAPVQFIDDYGHHPTEIAATLAAARLAWPSRRIVAVFQPHRFTRVRDLLDEFATCFHEAGHVVVCPVYRAGEAPIPGIDEQAIAERIGAFGHRSVTAVADLGAARDHLLAAMLPGDVVITLGAGDVNKLCQTIPEALDGQA